MWMDELTDFSSPFTLYVYAALLILIIRIVAVLNPLVTLFQKLSGTGIVASLFKLRRDANLKGVWALIVQEIASATAPALLALGLRIFVPLGDRQPEWTTTTTLGFIAVMTAVIALQLADILKIRDFLNTISGRLNAVLKHGVNLAVGTRNNLVKIASMSDPEFGLIFRREKEEVDPLLQRNEEGSLRLNATELKARGFNFFRNTQTVAYNTGQFGKGMAKKAAAKLRENMDAQMQKQVDVVTTSYNPMKAFLQNIGMAIVPLLYIFLIMYR